MKVTLSILAVLVCAVSGANAVELLSNNGFDSPLSIIDVGDNGAVPTLDTLTPGTWYTGQKGWDQSWSIQNNGTNNFLQYGVPMPTYNKQAIQFVAIPAAADGYAFTFRSYSSEQPPYGFGASIRLMNGTDSLYPDFFTPSEVGVYTEAFDTSGVWTNNSFTFNITADQAAAYKYLEVIMWGNGVGNPAGTSNLTIDDVSLIGAGGPALHAGDANGDNMVDVGDLGILGANYGTLTGATWATADFTGDGAVDVGDLGVLGANYGFGAAAGAVPEPATLSLLALGALALRRRK